MGRKTLAAILLPIPFAALPVVVVLAGALFGPKSDNGELVTRQDSPAIEQRLNADLPDSGDDSTLAKVASQDHLNGCDFDTQVES